MSDLNDDGLIPGQPVDFATLVRIENARKQPPVEPEQEEPVKHRGRPRAKSEE
jgi:hypothetical protein